MCTKQETIDLTAADISPTRALPSAAEERAARIAAVAAEFALSPTQMEQLHGQRQPCSKCDDLLRAVPLPVLSAMWLAAVQSLCQIAPLTAEQIFSLRREFAVKTYIHVEEIHRCLQVFRTETVVKVDKVSRAANSRRVEASPSVSAATHACSSPVLSLVLLAVPCRSLTILDRFESFPRSMESLQVQ